jgi:hypothetical protein
MLFKSILAVGALICGAVPVVAQAKLSMCAVSADSFPSGLIGNTTYEICVQSC